MAGKKHLLGMTLEELQQVVLECDMPKFAARQIADWLYRKKASAIDEMTNLSLLSRSRLAEKYEVGRQPFIRHQLSTDGTVKYLFKTGESKLVESVMIPESGRTTLCVSSQAGCKFNCLFCMTGKQGFNGNLTSSEILNQLFSVNETDKLTNVVFMGMGEPLDNYKELIKALRIMTSEYGLSWSPKRITVSTTGIIPELKDLLDKTNVHIAVSLHSPFPEERVKLMPVEKAYPLAKVLELLRQYDWSHQRRLSFEYIMFDKLNDSLVHAKELIRILRGLDCRVNLIRFHSIPGIDLKTSSDAKMESFRDYLSTKGITCTIRSSRGEDIAAACGMLSTQQTETEKIK